MTLIPRKRMSSDLLDPKPKKGSFNGVTSDGVFNATGEAIDNILDNGSASETVVVAIPVSQSPNYTVGNYYEVQGKVARLRAKTDGDNVTHLTFDTTSGLLDAINDIVEDITSIGSPLQWKGPATVAQLNAGITGIQPGWTYTLTDAGRLTDGGIAVEKDDEVAWTEDGEWFKVGGEGGKIAVFNAPYNSRTHTNSYPTFDEVNSARLAGKLPVIVETFPNNSSVFYVASNMTLYLNNVQFFFFNPATGVMLKLNGTTSNPTWSKVVNPKDVTVFNFQSGTVLPMSSVYAARDNGSLVFLRASANITIGFYTIESGTFFSLCTDTGRPGYLNHTLEFTCTGIFDGNVRMTAKVILNEDGTFTTSVVRLDAMYDAGERTYSTISNGHTGVDNVNAFTKFTLTSTSGTLTMHTNKYPAVNNFCVEIDNTGNSNDVTIDVQHGPDSLKYSVNGGNVVGAGKYMQLTCVGNCWTLAEFTVPTP